MCAYCPLTENRHYIIIYMVKMIDRKVVKMVIAATGGKIVEPRRVPVWEQWHNQTEASHALVDESIESYCRVRNIPKAS